LKPIWQAVAAVTNYLEQMRQSIKVVGRLSEESLSPPVRDELLAVFRNWKEKG
jgi:hypothetical protein